MENHIDDIKEMIKEIKSSHDNENISKLNVNKCERLVEKLASFSSDCEDCQQNLIECKNHFMQVKGNLNQSIDIELKQHKQFIQKLSTHLQKKHKLVPEGYYSSLYFSMGVSLGIVFGLTLFDNIGVGLPIGMCIGMAIGLSLDADAKKKGKVI